jgi:hypothetical protein
MFGSTFLHYRFPSSSIVHRSMSANNSPVIFRRLRAQALLKPTVELYGYVQGRAVGSEAGLAGAASLFTNASIWSLVGLPLRRRNRLEALAGHVVTLSISTVTASISRAAAEPGACSKIVLPSVPASSASWTRCMISVSSTGTPNGAAMELKDGFSELTRYGKCQL